MRTRRRVGLGICLFVLAVLSVVVPGASDPAFAQVRQEQATLTLVVGNIEVLAAGTAVWRRATIGMKLNPGDEVRAAATSEVELAMADGSVVKVTADTRLQIRQLDADPTTRVRNSYFHLLTGRIRAVVATAAIALVQARQGGFVISTPTAVAAVRGSDGVVGFNAATRMMTVMSFRGVWATMETATQRFVFVAQGQVSRAIPGAPPSTPTPVPANIQAAVLSNAPIRTPAPAAPPVTAPVAAGVVAAPAAAAPGAPPTAPPPPPPPVAMDLQMMVPPPPPPTAPPPPPAQVTVIPPTITQIPLAPPPPPPAEVAAVQAAMVAPPVAPPPPPPSAIAMTQVVVPPTIVVPPPAGPPPAMIAMPPAALLPPPPPPPPPTAPPPVAPPPVVEAPPPTFALPPPPPPPLFREGSPF